MNTYKIYNVYNYNKSSRNNILNFSSNNINDIIHLLNTDKAYHLLLLKDQQYKLFFDIDNVNDDNTFIEFLKFINNEYDLNFNDSSATKSTNSKGLNSYHLVYNNCKGYLHNFKKLAEAIKNNDEYKNKFNGLIDSSVYAHNKWFRLPNQTNENKHNPHTIIRGTIEDFIFDYFPCNFDENKENEINDELKKHNINKIKSYDNFKTKFR
jgi:hypothetical protein